jgi:hypothetical protein
MEENDDRSFEDHERILKEIKSLFFNTLYLFFIISKQRSL